MADELLRAGILKALETEISRPGAWDGPGDNALYTVHLSRGTVTLRHVPPGQYGDMRSASPEEARARLRSVGRRAPGGLAGTAFLNPGYVASEPDRADLSTAEWPAEVPGATPVLELTAMDRQGVIYKATRARGSDGAADTVRTETAGPVADADPESAEGGLRAITAAVCGVSPSRRPVADARHHRSQRSRPGTRPPRGR